MQAWDSFLIQLQEKFGDETFNKWLRPLKLVHFDACNLYLEAQNSFQMEWFEEHVRSFASRHFKTAHSQPIKIHITSNELQVKQKKVPHLKLTPTQSPEFTLKKDSLFEEMTLENFVFSEPNKSLRSYLERATQAKVGSLDFNPLLI